MEKNERLKVIQHIMMIGSRLRNKVSFQCQADLRVKGVAYVLLQVVSYCSGLKSSSVYTAIWW